MAEQKADARDDAVGRKNEYSRMAFYKKPISRDNYKLDVDDEECPQEVRRQQLLAYQKK